MKFFANIVCNIPCLFMHVRTWCVQIYQISICIYIFTIFILRKQILLHTNILNNFLFLKRKIFIPSVEEFCLGGRVSWGGD